MESSYSKLDARCKDSYEESDRLQEQWIHAQRKVQDAEDELTQLRAHADLYKLQTEDQIVELAELKVGVILFIYVFYIHYITISYILQSHLKTTSDKYESKIAIIQKEYQIVSRVAVYHHHIFYIYIIIMYTY